MKVALTPNTFTYTQTGEGIVANTVSGVQLVFDEVGAKWLSLINRHWQDVDVLVNKLKTFEMFQEVDTKVLTDDYIEFLETLKENSLVSFSDTTSPDINTEEATAVHNDYKLTQLFVEITDRCNERCLHCYIPQKKKDEGNTISLDDFNNLIDQFVNMGGHHVTLSGGEVILHKSLFDMIEYCRHRGLEVSILSNCVLLNKGYAQKLKKLDVSDVQVSLYSVDEHTHDLITGVEGSCARTMSAISILKTVGIEVKIAVSVLKENAPYVIDVVKFANNIGALIHIDPVIMAQSDLDTSNLLHRIDPVSARLFLESIADYDIDFYKSQFYNTTVEDSDLLQFLNRFVCEVGKESVCISPNGNVIPCAGWSGYILGNITSKTLSEIWSDNVKLDKLRMVKEKDFPECVDCKYACFCIRCLNKNYSENGDCMTIAKDFCNVAQLMTEIYNEHIILRKEL